MKFSASILSSFIILVTAYVAFSLSGSRLHVFIQTFTSHMLQLSDADRTTVCCTAGEDHRTRETDAQVTTLPGVKEITPSKLELHFYMLWGTSCKLMTNNICSWLLGKLCFWWNSSIQFCLCVHNQAPLSHQSNEASVSWVVTSLFHTSGCCPTLHICSLCLYSSFSVIWKNISSFRRYSLMHNAFLPFAVHVFIFPPNSKDVWMF